MIAKVFYAGTYGVKADYDGEGHVGFMKLTQEAAAVCVFYSSAASHQRLNPVIVLMQLQEFVMSFHVNAPSLFFCKSL